MPLLSPEAEELDSPSMSTCPCTFEEFVDQVIHFRDMCESGKYTEDQLSAGYKGILLYYFGLEATCEEETLMAKHETMKLVQVLAKAKLKE